jgi:hypothetical protein
MDVAGRDRVNLFLPQHGSDLTIYKRMLRAGAIRPYEMPEGIERLAEHLMKMLEVAQASGRNRDAIKCIEILRMLQADNRAMALELDKIERLDAGKPTTISGQVAPEVQDRIRRIVSTQRARSIPAQEESNDGSRKDDAPGLHARAAGARHEQHAEAGGGTASDGRDHQAAPDHRGAGAPNTETGEGR